LDDEEQRLAFYQRLNGVQEADYKGSESRPVNSVPQIFIDDKHIGGYDQLIERQTNC
jgi:glutaredoxin